MEQLYKQWGSTSPGHLVFLIDQSGSMYGDSANAVVDAVQSVLEALVFECLEGNDVRPRAFITIIGYGDYNSSSDGVRLVMEGDIVSVANELTVCANNGTGIIQAVADGGTPMDKAFELASQCVQKRLKDVKLAQMAERAPIVINITDGYPDSEKSTKIAAENLMNIMTADGQLLLFNVHIDDSSNEILFPLTLNDVKGNKSAEFLFSISSSLNEQFRLRAAQVKFEGVRVGAKGMVANANADTLIRFIEFGSIPAFSPM